MDKKNNLFSKQEPAKGYKTSVLKSPKSSVSKSSSQSNNKTVGKSKLHELKISSLRSPHYSTRGNDNRPNNAVSNKLINNKTYGSDSITMTRTQLNSLLALIGKLDVDSSETSNKEEIIVDTKNSSNNKSEKFENHLLKNSASLLEGNNNKNETESTIDRDIEKNYVNSAPQTVLGSWFANSDSSRSHKLGQCLSSPPPMLSVAEQKKQKWLQDKNQMMPEYNPWGKPGAGAPMAASSYARKAVLNCGQSVQAETPSTSPVQMIHSSRSLPPLSHAASSIVKPLPIALRTSLSFGDSSPLAYANETLKLRQRQEWLKELEKQREEQFQRKLREKELDRAYFNSEDSSSRLDTIPSRLQPERTSFNSHNSISQESISTFKSPEFSTRSSSDVPSKENLPDVLTGTPKLDSCTSTPEHTTYVENRILTPTKYRMQSRSAGRDFGTQTEPMPEFLGRKDVAVEADSDTENLSLTDDEKATQRSKSSESKPLPEKENSSRKPQWGVNQSERKYIKQSEKDPAYEKKRRAMQETRRKRLEQEAVIQRSRPQIGQERKSDADSLPSSSHSFRHISDSMPSSGEDTPSTTGTRRQRRQWQSPVKEHLEFYNHPGSLSPNPSVGRIQSPSPTRKLNNGHESRLAVYYNQSPKQQSSTISTSLNTGRISPPVSLNAGRRSPPVPALLNRLRPDSILKVSSTGYHSDTTDIPSGRSSSSISQAGFVPYTRSSAIINSREPSPVLPQPVEERTSGWENTRILSQPSLQNPPPNQPLNRSSSLPNTASLPLRSVPPPRYGSSPQRKVMTPRSSMEQDKILQQLGSLRQVLLNKQMEWENMVGQNEVDSS